MNTDMLKYTQNRELSWLQFNRRVLEEATDPSVPLLERMKFIAIFTSNLDEFFMIRVGSLYDMVTAGIDKRDSRSGFTPAEQLDKIYETVAPLYKERDKIYAEIRKQLQSYGVSSLSFKELEAKERKYVKKYFKEEILPLLSPQIVDANHPFPHLLNKELYVTANLKKANKNMLGIVPVPTYIPSVLYLPGEDLRYIRMEKVIREYMSLIFESYEVTEKNYICVTRNADITPDDEGLEITEDFRDLMKQSLHKRKRMAVVRLETAEKLSAEMEKFFSSKFRIKKEQIFRTKMPMKLGYMFGLGGKLPKSVNRELLYRPFTPQMSSCVDGGSMIRQIEKKDILLYYPFESMDPFLRLIKEASTDPSVMTIKITIYRLAQKARLVEYLCAAAENGKEVTVLIELRARFDEQNNIDWSERLEEAGCRVIYGFEGYKVHSKICLITYRSKNDIRYITQIGTGNYNEKTATMYTDLSLMTSSYGIGEDAAEFFKNMSIGNLQGIYEHLLVSPNGLKSKILQLIEEESKKGSGGRIIMKMNSITDVDVMEKLVMASQAGVKIDLIVRGICCILPGIEGFTDHVNVTSIVGRYLEHPRIFCFGTGEQQKMYIGSADMMTRNTEKRVEVACPIQDRRVKEQINHYITVMLADNVKARVLQKDGTYSKKEQKEPFIDSQATCMREVLEVKRKSVKPKKRTFKDRLKRLLKKFER